jgi:UrcA family protein
MNRYHFGVGLLALSFLCAGAASAKEDLMIVRVSDLNVASQPGAEVALRRIKNASAQFCGGDGDYTNLDRRSEQKACARIMTTKAVRVLNAPMVTALYAPRGAVELASRAP